MRKYVMPLIGFLLVSSISCGRSQVREREIVGTWLGVTKKDSRLKISHSKIEFNNIPAFIFEGGKNERLLSGEGTWALDKLGPSEVPAININVQKINEQSLQGMHRLELGWRRSNGKIVLYFTLGDPDAANAFEFQKET